MEKEKILIVEDEFIIAEALKENLLNFNYDVMDIVSTGEKTINVIKSNRPDIILMDIKINGDLDGIETAEHILKEFDIPVLYRTSYGDSELIKRAQKTSPYGYVSKSIPVNELHTNIQLIISKSRADRKLKHLNKLLKAIRNIHKIIITETNKEKLFEKICKFFVDTQEYSSSFIAIIDDQGKLTDFMEFGIEGKQELVKELLLNKKMTSCIEKAYQQSEVIYIKETESFCDKCPLLNKSPNTRTMNVSLKYEDYTYGIMSVVFNKNLDIDDEEKVLFKEVADDIAFALHKIDLAAEKDRASDALKFEQNFSSNIIRSMPGLFYVFEKESGRFQSRNKNWEYITGYSKDELDNMTILHFIEEGADRDMTIQKVMEVFTEGWSSMENFLLTKDHKKIPYFFTGSKVEIGNKMYLAGLGIDISERKKAEKELTKHNEQLKIFNQLAVDRELRMIELKQEINTLYKETGNESRYEIPEDLDIRKRNEN